MPPFRESEEAGTDIRNSDPFGGPAAEWLHEGGDAGAASKLSWSTKWTPWVSRPRDRLRARPRMGCDSAVANVWAETSIPENAPHSSADAMATSSEYERIGALKKLGGCGAEGSDRMCRKSRSREATPVN